ncbi:MAG: glycosyltransferase family 1 protein [Flavobacteriales bacterium]|jgi:glycosyltransferase involved in cell wall biosynthesis|nr:glycosyltransferase family 4 protein [Flavobacteriales bacterium]MDG1175567.1 glycosyltransferase family 1 protein [Flavobacteriales bacterium]
MKIGFDAKRLFLNNTGLGNYSRDLVRGILEQAKENDYFLYTTGGEIDLKTKFLKDHPNAEIVYPSGLYKKMKSYWRSVKLERELIKNGVEVYHGLSHEIPRKNKLSKIKYVVTIHDLIFLRFPENYNRIDRKIYKKKVEYACKTADKIIAISEQTKRDLMEFLNVPENKIEVIYQSCATSFHHISDYRYRDLIKNKYNLPENYILYVGTIEKRKNLATLIEAIGKSNTKLPLVAVGKQTDYTKEVMAMVDKYNLGNQVALLQNVSFLDLPSIYQSANLFVYPSFFEGFGIPVLEALYSKTPVIAAIGSCLEEAGGPNSIYIDPKNSDELASAIDRVIENPELQLEMKEKGFEYAQNFTSENQAKEVLEIYEGLV